MKTNSIKKSTLLILPFFFIGNSPSFAGSFNDVMDSSFNSMTNTTTAKSYKTARRGVFSGGEVFIANDVKRAKLVSATSPSFSASCGGLDFYGGSFSYLNADEMIETFQAIGSNALSYGVKLALTTACDTCQNIMTSLEKTAQAINKMSLDSCNAAQGIVNAAVDYSATATTQSKTTAWSSLSGYADDYTQAWTWPTTDGKSAASEMQDADSDAYAEQITGNLTWRAMVNGDLKASYTNGDNDLLEVLQAMVGTVIVGSQIDSESDPDSDGSTNVTTTADSNDEDTPSLDIRAGHSITLEQLINGSTTSVPLKVYSCNDYDEDGCLTPSTTPTKTISNVEGFKTKLENALMGSNGDGSGGLIAALTSTSNVDWPDDAKDLLSIRTPIAQECLMSIRKASSVNDVTTAVSIAKLCSGRMALEMSYATIIDYIETVRKLVIRLKSDNRESALDVFAQSKKDYETEYFKLSSQAPISIIKDQISTLLETIKIQRNVGQE